MTVSPPPPSYPLDQEAAPQLTPEVVADDDDLALRVDEFVRRSPEARAGQWEVALLQHELRETIDTDACRLVLRIDELVTARLADVTVLVARWSFLAGQRHPLPPTEVSS
jgi:hypothetical protein